MNKPINCGCGGEAHHVSASCWNPEKEEWMPNFWHQVICKNCGTQTKAFYTEAEAITAWNEAMGGQTAKVYVNYRDDSIIFGFCECGQSVNSYNNYCPKCGCRLEWG